MHHGSRADGYVPLQPSHLASTKFDQSQKVKIFFCERASLLDPCFRSGVLGGQALDPVSRFPHSGRIPLPEVPTRS